MFWRREAKKVLSSKSKITKKEIERFKKFSKFILLDPEREYFMYIRRRGRSGYKIGYVLPARYYLRSMRKGLGKE